MTTTPDPPASAEGTPRRDPPGTGTSAGPPAAAQAPPDDTAPETTEIPPEVQGTSPARAATETAARAEAEAEAGAEPEAVLPTTRERRLHPLSWLFVLLSQIGQMLVPLVAVVVFGASGEDGARLLVLAVALAALLAAAFWRYLTFSYRIGDDSVFVRSGLFERSLRQIPFSRIHDVALHQNLLHRLFGVAEVRLESAGGSQPEARMQVLAMDEALALEAVVRRRAQGAAAPGTDAATAHDEAPPTRTLLALSTGEVIRLGLVSNRGMVVVAGAIALAMQALPDNLAGRVLTHTAQDAFGYASHLGGSWHARLLAGALLILVALVALRLLSVALALVQYHGFRLVEDGRRLGVERGLLTRMRNSVPRRRIQSWTLHEGMLHRLLRRRGLQIDTAVVARGQESRGLSELAPIAAPAACDDLVRHLLPERPWPPPHWRPLHRRAWLRLLPPGIVVALALAAALSWWFGAWGLLGLLWLPWSVLVAVQHARRAGYALEDGLVSVREGWWTRHWRFAEVGKLQALRLRQSPLDRLTGMASVWLDTAGAGAMAPSLRIPYLPVAEARALLARLNRDIARQPLRW